MSHRNVVSVILVILLLSFGLGFILTDPETYGVCKAEDFFECTEPMITQFGQPLFMGSIALALIFLILIFLSERFFKAWLKYAAWFIPVGILLITFTDTNCRGGLGLGLCFDKELATWWSSGIFLVLSLVVIGATALTHSKTQDAL